MNVLIEIADKDIFFVGLAVIGLIIFGIVIFFTLTKDKVKPISEDERYDTSPDLFPDMKPTTEEGKKAKDELERVFNQMANDLEEKEERPIEQFEREQEENAIISYQELIKQAEIKKQKEKEQKKPQKCSETLEKKAKKEEKQLKLEIEEEPKKFRNSEIISPIFGIQGSSTYETPKMKEDNSEPPRHAYEKTKVSYKSKDNTEFLNSLKEFRKNL